MAAVTVRRVVVALSLVAALLSACAQPAQPEEAALLRDNGTRETSATATTGDLSGIVGAVTSAPPVGPTVAPGTAVAIATTSTATPQPTPTASATPIPPSAPLPGVEEVVPGALPPISGDLLFLAGSGLKLWRAATGQVEELAHDVRGYDMAADGQQLLLVRAPGGAGQPLQLVLLGVDGEPEQLLVRVEDRLVDFALSPDGRHVAYLLGEADPQGNDVRPAEPIYVLEAKFGAEPGIVATCNPSITIGERQLHDYFPCAPLVWSLSGERILWGDGVGVWEVTPGSPPLLLVANELYVDDPPRLFRPTRQWSPDGRYQLLQGARSEGSTRYVYDTVTQQLIEVPKSTSGLGEVAYWIWTDDSRLFTVQSPWSFAGEAEASAERWAISGAALELESAVTLPEPKAAVPAAPTQFQDGRFAFVLDGSGLPPALHGLYVLPSFAEKPQLVNRLPQLPGFSPPHGQTVVWAPDGSGAIVSQLDPGTGATGFVLYASSTTGRLYDLQGALGQDLHSFAWLP